VMSKRRSYPGVKRRSVGVIVYSPMASGLLNSPDRLKHGLL
jgi:aryl-alcohol dehydrogenase-like predicted oxidoreductase